MERASEYYLNLRCLNMVMERERNMNGMDMILLGVSIFLPSNARTGCISGIWANKKKLSGWICNQSWINFVVFCVLTEWYLGSSSPYQSHSSTIYFLASDCFRNPILADLKVHPPVTYAWLLEYLSFVLKMYKQFLDPVSICAKKTIPARICIQVETAKYLHSQQSSSFVYWYIFFLSWSLSSWDDSTFQVLGTQFLPTLLGLATLCLSSRSI